MVFPTERDTQVAMVRSKKKTRQTLDEQLGPNFMREERETRLARLFDVAGESLSRRKKRASAPRQYGGKVKERVYGADGYLECPPVPPRHRGARSNRTGFPDEVTRKQGALESSEVQGAHMGVPRGG